MAIWRRLQGRTREEASQPDAGPAPHPLPGGGGRSPYSGYDVMAPDKWAHDWDEKTRRLILDRITNVPTRSFFTEAEFATLEAISGRLLPQEDRPPDRRIPIAPWIDKRLSQGEGNGYRYAEMPWDDEAYRCGLAGVDEAARALGGAPFVELDDTQQDALLAGVEDGHPPGAAWQRVPAGRFFRVLIQDVVAAYYAHPAAWNEIGFGGPASPRGHIRLALGKRDPWEAEETAPLAPEERQTVEQGGGAGMGGATH